ncbi:MAG: hypothetical protein ABSG59_10065 [Verrucomicrobiota bacterium]|jgi:anti-sigma factor RsiW
MKRAMMQDADYQRFTEISWRRPLTAEEKARVGQWLAAHPECLEKWEEEEGLDRLLHRLGAAPVSSNFTARVVQAAQRAPVRSGWGQGLAPWRWMSSGWRARLALGAAMVCCATLSFREYQAVHRAQVAREVASVGRLAALAPMDWLKDFDTINRLNKVTVADDDLLAVLQ